MQDQIDVRVSLSQLTDGTKVTMFSIRLGRQSGDDLQKLNDRFVTLEREGAFRTPIALVVGADDALVASVVVLRLALSFWVVAVNRPGWGNIVVASRSDRLLVGDAIEVVGTTGPS